MSGKRVSTGPSPAGGHRLALFDACKRRFAIEKHHPGGTGSNPYFARGTVGHAGHAAYYCRLRATQLGQNPNEWMSPEEAVHEAAAEVLRDDHQVVNTQIVLATLYAYWDHYRVIDSGWRILHVEEHFDTYIDGFRFTPKPDVVYADRQGFVYFVDHKMVGRISGQKQIDFYSTSRSLLGMRWAGPHLFPGKFGGVVLNLCQLAPNTAFARPPLKALPQMILDFPQSVVDTERDIARWEASGRPPMSWPPAMHPDACAAGTDGCPALNRFCSGMHG